MAIKTVLAILFFVWHVSAVPVVADEPAPGEEDVVAPGQEELLLEMLGRGTTLAGNCKLTDGQVADGVITATYNCSEGEVIVELRHPDKAPAAATRTSRFAIAVRSGSSHPGLMDVLASRIRSREIDFKWTRVGPSPSPRPSPTAAPSPTPSPVPSQPWWPEIKLHTVAGVIAALAFAWLLRRVVGWFVRG